MSDRALEPGPDEDPRELIHRLEEELGVRGAAAAVFREALRLAREVARSPLSDTTAAPPPEPTPAMVAAGESAASVYIGKPTDDDGIPLVWRRMYEAWLRESGQEVDTDD